MTELRWVKVGTYTSDVEADEVTRVLDEAQIPYTRAGELGAWRAKTGSIEVSVPTDYVDAAKVAFAHALEHRARPANGGASDAAVDPELAPGLARERRRVRNAARFVIGTLAVLCASVAAHPATRDKSTAFAGVMAALAVVVLWALVASFRRPPNER